MANYAGDRCPLAGRDRSGPDCRRRVRAVRDDHGSTVHGMSAWAPPRMMAAIVLGEGLLPPPATFAAGIMMVAMLVHFARSIIFALLIAAVVQRTGVGTAIASGALTGLLIYYIDFYLFTAVFPWFALARNSHRPRPVRSPGRVGFSMAFLKSEWAR